MIKFLKTIDCTQECFEQFHTEEIFNAVSYLLKEKKHNSLSRLIEYGFPLDFKNKDGLNIKEMIEQAVPNANKIVVLNKIIEQIKKIIVHYLFYKNSDIIIQNKIKKGMS